MKNFKYIKNLLPIFVASGICNCNYVHNQRNMKKENDFNENIKHFKKIIEYNGIDFRKIILNKDYKEEFNNIEKASFSKTFEEYKKTIDKWKLDNPKMKDVKTNEIEQLFYFYTNMRRSNDEELYSSSEKYIKDLRQYFGTNKSKPIITSCFNGILLANITPLSQKLKNTKYVVEFFESQIDFQMFNLFCTIIAGYETKELLQFFSNTILPAMLDFNYIGNQNQDNKRLYARTISRYLKGLLNDKGLQQECIQKAIDFHVSRSLRKEYIETIKLFSSIITPGIVEPLDLEYISDEKLLNSKFNNIGSEITNKNIDKVEELKNLLLKDLCKFFSNLIPNRCKLNQECLNLIHSYLDQNLCFNTKEKKEMIEEGNNVLCYGLSDNRASYELCKEFFNVYNDPNLQKSKLLYTIKNYDDSERKPSLIYASGLLANLKDDKLLIKITEIAINKGIKHEIFWEACRESHNNNTYHNDDQDKDKLKSLYDMCIKECDSKNYAAVKNLLYICTFSKEEAIEKLYEYLDTNIQNTKDKDLGSYNHGIDNIYWELASIIIYKIQEDKNDSINLIRLLLKFNGYDKYGNCHSGRSYNMKHNNSLEYNNIDKGINDLNEEEAKILKFGKLEQKEIKRILPLATISGRESSHYQIGPYHKAKERIAKTLINMLDVSDEKYILNMLYVAIPSGIRGAAVELFKKLDKTTKEENIEKIYATAVEMADISKRREPNCAELALYIENHNNDLIFVLNGIIKDITSLYGGGYWHKF